MAEIRTVRGKISADELGITSTHEHVLADVSVWFKELTEVSRRKVSEQKVNLTNIGILHRNPWVIKDNLVLDDVDLAIEELLEFKKAGGSTIVDATTRYMGRDPLALKAISIQIGLHIIAGCGYYFEENFPPSLSDKTISEIAEGMIKEIEEGIDNTDISPGVIGEVGSSKQITENEEKALRAAARTQLETNLTIIVHPYPWGGTTGMQILDIIEREGVPLNRVIMSHMDCDMNSKYHKAILDRGAYIEFDNFGKEYYLDIELTENPRDTERIEALCQLMSDGYISKILLATDICLKMDLHRYGGWGYDHILTNIVPRLRKIGISKEETHKLLVLNPKRALTGEES
ncbi:MAG: phosphotriesterase-related protein [Candidatus Aminicenantes bacterium]|nr:MAG: phosphotriesterase-related protein [Candidatus Aminicenantes bacterium]